LRLTSGVWVAAFIRRYNGAGASAALMHHGAEEAGAIFIVVDRLDGTADLYAPAPQSSFDDARPSDRKFQRVLEDASGSDIATRLDREKRFDPDLWIVAIEDREARVLFETV
jgi:hypothetical protein